VDRIPDWNGREIEVVRSRGGVLAVADPFEGLIRTGIEPWPPPEIVSKLCASRHARAYAEPERIRATESRGHYSDLQSLRSEDALTWGVFGPVVYAHPEARVEYLNDLLGLAGLLGARGPARAWLWRRIPHPEKPLASGGPEIDVAFQAPDVVVLGEAKWGSSVGRGQGVAKDRTQIELRTSFCETLGSRFFPGVKRFVVLGVSRDGTMLEPEDRDCGESLVSLREVTWEEVVKIASHPLVDEVQRYLNWKSEHSAPRSRLVRKATVDPLRRRSS
jgi:hypothetical protein